MSRLLSFLRRVKRHVLYRLRPPPPSVSTEYAIVDAPRADEDDGWRTETVAERQHEAFAPLLEAARNGQPRIDFEAAARAVDASGLWRPSVLEVGCGSGYYSEILPLLLRRPIDYLGVDYSPHMVALARRAYPGANFLAADARSLPFDDSSFDVVISGTSLMHIVEYDRAIAESVRVARSWCVFHSVPLLEERATTLLSKRAYGEPVTEVIFNRGELERAFTEKGLRIAQVYDSIEYDLSHTLGERTYTKSYLCQKTS